ncbi:hypothetical protein AMTR_s00018p00071080 [Amborella trichopoda]|uniref:Uncharacterized protein n=1 Tax=Amborella trichopoda TaxID=13333 RepID=W1PLU1_AMBTC|nr:hypothetical protein AMTR_s00018p00071080 [Amborella trichopoda]
MSARSAITRRNPDAIVLSSQLMNLSTHTHKPLFLCLRRLNDDIIAVLIILTKTERGQEKKSKNGER